MKKVVSILLCLVLLTGAVFAAEGRIGVSLVPEWFFGGPKVNNEVSDNTGSTSFMLLAEGANYF